MARPSVVLTMGPFLYKKKKKVTIISFLLSSSFSYVFYLIGFPFVFPS